ncbi:unnamed protein product [Protopolystoma xenopodis]|uniref:Major facilitator superfamily (MFS) profile domain-containing protein n=1 Tax=Protopolystoma xenopodis TaxID=117903 RepID=A0A3S5CE67_9PLAT|nr:unnamed protein product [Protopolystoma xenopodis]
MPYSYESRNVCQPDGGSRAEINCTVLSGGSATSENYESGQQTQQPLSQNCGNYAEVDEKGIQELANSIIIQPFGLDPTSTVPSVSATEQLMPREYNIDQLLKQYVGELGLWQWIIVLLSVISTSPSSTLPVYLHVSHQHRCRAPGHLEGYLTGLSNLSFDQAARFVGPWPDDNISTEEKANLGNGIRRQFGCLRYRLPTDWLTKNWTQTSETARTSGDLSSDRLIASLTRLDKSNLDLESCLDSYVYQASVYQYPGPVDVEFNLVCENRWLSAMGTSAFMLGMMLGFIFGGWLGDLHGRRPTVLAFSVVEVLAGLSVSLAPNFASYAVLRCLVGIAFTAKVTCLSVLSMELTLAHNRSFISSIRTIFMNFTLPSLLVLAAYLLPDWRSLNSVAMLPSILAVFYITGLPESPRWLLSQGRRLEALCLLRHGYQVNHHHSVCLNNAKKTNNCRMCIFRVKKTSMKDKKDEDEICGLATVTRFGWPDIETQTFTTDNLNIDGSKQAHNSSGSPTDFDPAFNPFDGMIKAEKAYLEQERVRQDSSQSDRQASARVGCLHSLFMPFSTWQLARITIFSLILFTGYVTCMFGLFYYASFIRGHIYIVTLLNTASCLPALLISGGLYRLFRNRRWPLIGVSLLAAFVMLTGGLHTLLARPTSDTLLIICSNLALVFLVAGVNMIYIYVQELFPSQMRTQGLGTASGLGRVGTVICTFINQLEDINGAHGSPLVVYAGVILLFGFGVLVLMPNTTGENLPDVIGQMRQKSPDSCEISTANSNTVKVRQKPGCSIEEPLASRGDRS